MPIRDMLSFWPSRRKTASKQKANRAAPNKPYAPSPAAAVNVPRSKDVPVPRARAGPPPPPPRVRPRPLGRGKVRNGGAGGGGGGGGAAAALRRQRHAPPPAPVPPPVAMVAPRGHRRRSGGGGGGVPSSSSFNTADYSELFGPQMSDWAGMTAVPKPGRAVRRGSTRESVRPSGLGGGTHGGEPDLVVIDGSQVGSTGGTDTYDTDVLYSALHYYTRIGVRCVAVVPWWAFDAGLSLADKAKLRTDMLRGRIMASPPTSRHELFVRDVARRFRAYIVTNGGVPADLQQRTILFTAQPRVFRPRNGPGVAAEKRRS